MSGALPRWAATAAVSLGAIVFGAGPAVAAPPEQPRETVSVVQTTADLSERLTRLPDRRFTPGDVYGVPVIDVEDSTRYQRIGSFGAAMTDSAAWLLADRAASPARALDALFGADGLRLGFVRVPMGASDFSAGGVPYSYDDLPLGQSDATLANFSIAHDFAYIIPMLRAARALNPAIRMIATPWSPPGWMKANDSLANPAHSGALVPPAWPVWAQYFVRFLQAYAAAGVPVQAISLQNEPDNATTYPGLELPAALANHLLLRDLVPALRAAHLTPQIYGGELGWSGLSAAYTRAVASARTASLLTGMAWHCYFGTPDAMERLHRIAPQLDEIVSECATGLVPFPASEILIAALRDWASSVALWNLALDPTGGPVEQPNTGCPGCDGLLTVDGSTGSVRPTLSYYQLGQVSRYVSAGASRIGSEHYVRYHFDWHHERQSIVTPGVDDVAFVNPDGRRVLVVYANTTAPASFAVAWHGGWFLDTLPAGATVTFSWRPPRHR